MAEVKAYAVAIETSEFFGWGVKKVDDSVKRMKGSKGFLGVYPAGASMALLYDTPEHAKAAFNSFNNAGYSVKIIANPAYIDTKYLRSEDK